MVCVLVVQSIATACTRDGAADEARATAKGPVLVYSASDLRDALAELAQLYRTNGGDSLVLVFGSTGDLTTQILNGAPADLFFAANAKAIDDLSAKGRVVDSTRSVYALGRLAVLARCASRVRDSLPSACPRISLDDLSKPDIKLVAIADPSYAPYGLAARQALERSNLWSLVKPKIVMGANVSQAEQFVRTGNADAGVISLALLLRTPGQPYTLVDASLHDPLLQTVAVISGSAHANQAMRFLRFMETDAAMATMQRYGFTVPQRDMRAPAAVGDSVVPR
jgi:molybdate transport system substrate-binding protein